MVEDRGLEPTSGPNSTLSSMGRQEASEGKIPSQAGQPQEVTQTPDVVERTDTDKDGTSTGRPESTTRAQQEHNGSTMDLPPDVLALARKLAALPPETIKALKALLD